MTLEDAQNAAKKAVQFDGKNQYKQALYYYNMAVKYLSQLQDSIYVQKLSEYRERISTIESLSEYFILLCDIIQKLKKDLKLKLNE